jgi:CheY-like chemotaxis protein
MSVLIATDAAVDADIIRKSLGSEFESIHVSTEANRSVADFDSVRPDVLILAFDKIIKSERLYLDLFRHSKTIAERRHRTILLCTKEEVREAYDLCRRDCFDDYVLYWPVTFDHPRLAMSLRLAMRALEAERRLPEPTKLREAARDIAQITPMLDAFMARGDRHLLEADAGIRSLAQGIGDAVQDVADGLASMSGAGMAREVRRRLQSLRDDYVEPRVRDVADLLAPAREVLSSMSGAYRNRISSVRDSVASLETGVPTVMIVEDEPTQRQLFKHLLRSRCSLVFASTGAEALRIAGKATPDLILMDIMLPDLDGIAITRRLKSIPRLAHVPVVVITGHSERAVVMKSVEAGAVDFLVKPITPLALDQKLEQYLGPPSVTEATVA